MINFRVDLGGETVTVLTAGTETDPYGDTVEDWDTPTERDVVTIAPPEPRPINTQSGGEPAQDARHAIVSGWTLYLPPADPVNARNRVRVRGEVYPVQGEPADWPPGVVVQAFRTIG